MTDDRALAWRHFLPAGVRFLPAGGPEWWRNQLGAKSVSDGLQVPVVWGETPPDAWLSSSPIGVVLVNPREHVVRKLRALGFEHVRRFAVLPRLSNARWFVPHEPRRLTAAAMQLYTPYRWKALAAHAGVRVAARLGVSPWRKQVIVVASRQRSPVEELLLDTLGSPPVAFTISTGTPGPTRKVTLAALDWAGRIRAICKLAESPLACRLLMNEAACLRTLSRHSNLVAHCPRLIADHQIEGGRVIVLEGIQGKRAGVRLSSLHDRLLSSLASGPMQPATSSQLFMNLQARAHALKERGSRVLQLLDWAGQILEKAVLPRTIVHGDFAPWNLRIGRDRLIAFDWEYGQSDGLPLLDEIHHLIQVGFLVYDWSVDRSLSELSRQAAAGRHGLSREQIQALQAVYLLDAYLRRKEEGYPASDALLSRQAELLTRFAISAGARLA